MSTMQMLGYNKLEVLNEQQETFVCRAQSKDGAYCIVKAFKDGQPTKAQLEKLEHEYNFLKAENINGFIEVKALIKNYQGYLLIMEDHGGVPLIDAPIFQSIRKGKKDLDKAALIWILQIFIEMSEIIASFHERNCIHQAINPFIFLYHLDLDSLEMIDAGMATASVASGTADIQNQFHLNTLAYISPEQTGRFDRKIDYRSDLYALGVTLYELVTGQKPFTAESPVVLVHCHIAEKPIPPNQLNPFIPDVLSDIILKLLEKASEQRYQSTAGLISDFNRCLTQLSNGDELISFKLGEHDSGYGLQLLKKLYGRNDEKETIKTIYRQVKKGSVRVLMIGGYSGVGKTTIVQQICRPITETGGYFASGKAEQFQQNAPYFVFTQAVQDLVETLCQESDFLLEQWKESLLEALKGNGQVMLDIVPELAAIIGAQPPVSALTFAENKYRFFHTFGNLIKTIAQKNHPLTICLDDLQWCDSPSIDLIKYLVSRDDIESLMLICCYRDNEIVEGQPLAHLIDALTASEKTTMLKVQSLTEANVIEMLKDALQIQEDRAIPLANIVYKKSQGNPFFIGKLLRLLSEDNYLHYDSVLQQWDWNLERIENVSISDNIVAILIDQLLRLPTETIELLKQASLIGGTFNLKVLAEISDLSPIEVSDRLRCAVEDEIIQTNNNVYDTGHTAQIRTYNFEFRFAHDRVQQACVEMMDLHQQKLRHLKIGRILKQNTPSHLWQEHAMDIVSHLNEAIEHLETEEERLACVRLNLWASQKAKASSAFYLALKYIENSVSLLPETAWTQNYDLALSVYKTYVECAYLNNEYVDAEEKTENLLLYVKRPIEQAEIRWMQSNLYNYQGRLDKAIEYAFQGLAILQIQAPLNPKMPLILKEMAIVRAGLIGKNQEKLLNLPQMENEKIKIALKLWNQINSAAYLFGNNNLFLLSILMQMKLTLRYGSHREIGKTYISYAMILAVMGDLKGTFSFCELARLSCEQEKSSESMPTILFSSGFFGHAWNRPWTGISSWFEQAMEEAIKYGDHHTIALAGAFMYAYQPNERIEILIEKAMKQFPLVKQTDNRSAINFAFLITNRWSNYAGLTDSQFSLSVSQETFSRNGGHGIVFSEEACLEALREGNFLSAYGVYYKEKAYIHYLYDDYVGAMKYLEESDKYLSHHLGTPYMVECIVCNFLILAANLPDMNKTEARKTRKRLLKEYRQMKRWAKHCPSNFAHLHYLMAGELARLNNKPYKAVDFYDQAIQCARQNGFMRDEALANELAGKHYLALRKDRHAAVYLMEAYNGYQLWGAHAKVKQMTTQYKTILKLSEQKNNSIERDIVKNELDMLSIINASKAVSNEEQLPNLLKQIMRTVMENSGAQRGTILLKTEDEWCIEAEKRPEMDETVVMQSIPLEDYSDQVPTAIINFCLRTKESVVLEDASQIGRYTNNPYIRDNQVKSLLCMPIMNQGSIEGIVYLENSLSSNVFTKDRMHVLQLLAAQYSILIKNVQLFSTLLAKNEEVHQATEEVLRSDIAFLQAQIKPHFLYNAINTISAFSLDDSQTARDLLANLSQYLRGSFDFKNRDKLVTLRKELELVEAYLSIEKARFGDRLNIVYKIEEGADCLLPPLVIQPIVENAVHHGLSSRKNGGIIEITVRSEVDQMVIVVEDDGVGMDDDTMKTLFEDKGQNNGSVAIKNIQMRLTQFYGRGLEIEQKNTGGTKVTIKINK